jgi:hypothetical protein
MEAAMVDSANVMYYIIVYTWYYGPIVLWIISAFLQWRWRVRIERKIDAIDKKLREHKQPD